MFHCLKKIKKNEKGYHVTCFFFKVAVYQFVFVPCKHILTTICMFDEQIGTTKGTGGDVLILEEAA